MIKWMVLLLGLLCLSGCDDNPKSAAAASASPPAWIDAPSYPQSRAATACVPASGNQQQDASRADLKARQQLARQISDAQGETDIVEEDDGRVRTQVNQMLVNSQRVRGEYVEINGSKQFCSMMIIRID